MTPREFISKALTDATTTFEFFDALVAKMEADVARIAELEQALAACYVELTAPKDYPVEPSE